jgi:ABC-type lipoprotein export system ATPase subunit
MIQITDLHFSYPEGDFALDIPDLRIEAGERVAVIGPSGSGKTTLLHLVSGIKKPPRGRILTGGEDITALDEPGRRAFRIRKIGLVFQEFELLEYLTVLDNILLPYRIHSGLELDNRVRARAKDLAETVGLAEMLGRFPGRLSHGERQRIAVCRALLCRPALILADEPTGNLDPGNKGRVLDILLEHAMQTEATLVTVTHDHNLLDRFQRVIDFEDFHSLAEAAPESGR